jgi:hypothetical protein
LTKNPNIPRSFDLVDYVSISVWLISRWRLRLEQSGYNYRRTANEMRKQGVPLSLALKILCGRRDEETQGCDG